MHKGLHEVRPSRRPPLTLLHLTDPYENIYLVIRGSKTFTLLPPSEFYCLHGTSFLSTIARVRELTRMTSLQSASSPQRTTPTAHPPLSISRLPRHPRRSPGSPSTQLCRTSTVFPGSPTRSR